MNAPPTRNRFHWHPASVAAAVCVLLICTGPRLARLSAETSPVVWRPDSLRPTDSWNTLTFEASITHTRVTATGSLVGTLRPRATYRIKRSTKSGRWKTVIDVLSLERAPIYDMSGVLVPRAPLPVARIEDDEDGTPIRMFDSLGRSITSSYPTPNVSADFASKPPRLGGNSWIRSLIVPATQADKDARQREFEQLYGHSTVTNGLQRFCTYTLDTTHEVLVDPAATVVVDDTESARGALTSRRAFAYYAVPADSFVRTAVHAEMPLGVGSSDREVTDSAFSYFKLDWRVQ